MPDDSVKSIQYCGDIILNNFLVLRDVLFIPEFKHNLLSISKLAKERDMKFIFDSEHCVSHGLKTGRIVGKGRLQGQLYILDLESKVGRNDEVVLSISKNVNKSRDTTI